MRGLPTEQVVDGQADVARDFPEQRRRDVAPLVEWDRRGAPVCVAELLVRSALADLFEAERLEQPDDFLRR